MKMRAAIPHYFNGFRHDLTTWRYFLSLGLLQYHVLEWRKNKICSIWQRWKLVWTKLAIFILWGRI